MSLQEIYKPSYATSYPCAAIFTIAATYKQ